MPGVEDYISCPLEIIQGLFGRCANTCHVLAIFKGLRTLAREVWARPSRDFRPGAGDLGTKDRVPVTVKIVGLVTGSYSYNLLTWFPTEDILLTNNVRSSPTNQILIRLIHD